MSAATVTASRDARLRDKPGAWVDLGLTLPIFLGYHLGVVFLKVRNGTDLVTGELLALAHGEVPIYLAETACIGVIFAGIFALAGRGQAFRPKKFLQIAVEGAIYATLMALGPSYIVGQIFAATNSGAMTESGPLVGAIMFSGVHYVGALGDPFQLPSFVFRLLLGVALTVIYLTRGFAAAVWAHALYDLWILVLPHTA